MTAKKLAKRQAILEAAGGVFAKHGYEHSSIRDVAQAAGVADGTIYNYFADKEDLVLALIDSLISGMAAMESQEIGLADPDNLEERTDARMRQLHDGYGLMAAVLPVILGDARLRLRFKLGFVDPVLVSLEGEIPAADKKLASRLLMSTVLGFQVLMLLGDQTCTQAWEQPGDLAKIWTSFLRQASS